MSDSFLRRTELVLGFPVLKKFVGERDGVECLLLLGVRLFFPLQFAEKMGNAVSLHIGEVKRFSEIPVIVQPLQVGCSRIAVPLFRSHSTNCACKGEGMLSIRGSPVSVYLPIFRDSQKEAAIFSENSCKNFIYKI